MGRAKNTVVVINYINNILILTGILLAVLSQNTVGAAQPVIFKPPQEQSAPESLLDCLSANDTFAKGEIEIAKSDLNNDYIDEYIIKSTRCTPAKGCHYMIVADNNGDFIVIGEFSAKNISLSDKQTHGIRDILVYNQGLNDYAHNTLKWDMDHMHYSFNKKRAG